PQVVEMDPVVVRPCVACVEEQNSLDAGIGDDRENDFVVDDELAASADLAAAALDAVRMVAEILARTERARLEAAHRVDAAGEIALRQRQLLALEAAVADAVSERSGDRIHQSPAAFGLVERIVPARRDIE